MTVAELTDAQLVAATIEGDPGAFQKLLERHQRRIYNLAYRMVGPDDARDATQDAFLGAYRKLSSFRGEAAFSTWLYRIGMNACYDMLRTRARTPEPVDELPEHGDFDGVSDPADTAGTNVDVQRALQQVPEDFRTVLILHDVQDQPYEQIASILDIPLGTVKSRLHRGRAMLGAILMGTPEPSAPSEGAR